MIGSSRGDKRSPRVAEIGNGRSWASRLAVVAISLLVALLAGCGGGGSSTGSATKGGAESSVVEALQTGPIDFKVLVDDSTSRASKPLIEQTMADVENAFELTLAAGGSFSAVAIRGDLGSIPLTATAEVPSGGDDTELSTVANRARAELKAAKKELLKMKSAAPGLRGGSALAYDLRQALASVDNSSGMQTMILMVTDGVDDSVKGHLGESSKRLAARLSSHLGSKSKHNASTWVIIAGVGESENGAPGGAANRLKAAWKQACEATGAHCSVSTEVEDPVLLEAFGDA